MSRLSLALAALLMAAAPATADVTPREVWDGWLASLDGNEADITTSSVEETGGDIVVTGLSISAETDDGGRYALAVDEVALVQNGDGTVGVTVSPEYPIVLGGTDTDGVETETHLRVAHPDLKMTVADDGTTHVFSAPSIRIAIEKIMENGEPLDMSGSLALSDTDGQYDVGGDEGAESRFSAAEITFDLAGTDPDTSEPFTARVGLQGFDSTNVLQLFGVDTATLARRLPEGSSLEGGFTTDSASFSFLSETESEKAAFSGTLGPGRTRLGISGAGLDQVTETSDVALSFSGSSIPLPELTLEVADASVGLRVPLLAKEEVQPYGLSLSMLGVALDEGLWNMVDPAGILPRDPGEIEVDLSGDMLVEQDVDARDMSDGGDEVRSMLINTARLAIAEAEIDAGGELQIEQTAEGIPSPTGRIDVTLTGATRLLDRLVQVGIVPQQQAMGARMMLSMFATPGTTDDELVSAIRFTEDGHVFVNEQQVR